MITAFISSIQVPVGSTRSLLKTPTCPCVQTNSRNNASSHRMKLITHEKLDIVFNSGDGEMAKYKLTIEIPGEYSRKKRRESVQDMRRNSNFPGFRKGTIPPFLYSQIDSFVFRDTAEEMIDEAVQQLDLERSDGEDRDAQYDFDELVSQFKVGTDFSFDCEVVLASVKSDPIDVDKLDPVTDDEGKPLPDIGADLEQVEKAAAPAAEE